MFQIRSGIAAAAALTAMLLCVSAGRAEAQRVTVTVQEEGRAPRVETFTTSPIRVGRSKSNDLVLTARTVSRKHCQIVVEGGEVVVVDLGSKNGTEVKGRDITSKTRLGAKDVVGVGPYTLTVRVEGEVKKQQEEVSAVSISHTGTLRFEAVDTGRRSVAAYKGVEFTLELGGKGGGVVNLKPSDAVSRDQLKALAGRRVMIRGVFVKGGAPEPWEQAPLGADGKPQRRPDFYRVLAVEPR